ncbi:MAG TPA: copper homeostasis protein CutC [Erysipelotrichaceae bacterium]|nr:copper homeostasis protein CutC [Erysipelotrichaceae bacterium]
MNKIKMEACCGSVRDVLIAEKLGFDQIELNNSIEIDGMTPSVGTLVMAKKHTDMPIYPMVRARPQGFNYLEEDYEAMLFDAKNLIEHGADGIVFGFLNDDATINIERTKEMIKVIGDKDVIFHRALDYTKDIEESLKQLINLGVDRVLTSGGQGDIVDNIELLSHLQTTYGSEIEIVVGGGIRPYNVREILEKTGISQVHFSGRTRIFDQSTFVMGESDNKDDYSYDGVSEENLKEIMLEVEKVEK